MKFKVTWDISEDPRYIVKTSKVFDTYEEARAFFDLLKVYGYIEPVK